MATKQVNTGLPQGFKSPFNRVPMKDRMDDSLACVATLTSRPLEVTCGLLPVPWTPC